MVTPVFVITNLYKHQQVYMYANQANQYWDILRNIKFANGDADI